MYSFWTISQTVNILFNYILSFALPPLNRFHTLRWEPCLTHKYFRAYHLLVVWKIICWILNTWMIASSPIYFPNWNQRYLSRAQARSVPPPLKTLCWLSITSGYKLFKFWLLLSFPSSHPSKFFLFNLIHPNYQQFHKCQLSSGPQLFLIFLR